MQELKMPLSKIEEIFTKSELAIMAWTSQEQAADLEKIPSRIPKRKSLFQKVKSPEQRLAEELTGDEEIEQDYEYEEQPTGLDKRFYNSEGEIDLRQVTGKEAVNFMSRAGIRFMPIFKG